MSHHQLGEIEARTRPSQHEVALAADLITRELATGIASAAGLKVKMEERFRDEPGLDMTGLEGVQEADLRVAKAARIAALALAHLEASGHILPYGPRRTHEWQTLRIPYQQGGYSAGYTFDPVNFELADTYVLPLSGLAPEPDAPAVFLDHLPAAMGSKVKRVLLEATHAYRGGLFVATVVLLGTASEAAWEQVALATQSKTGDKKLAELLANPLTAAAVLQARTLEVLTPLKLVPVATLSSLDASARAYRDLRNHAVHEPERSFDETLFARGPVGTLLIGGVSYFTKLYELRDRVAAP